MVYLIVFRLRIIGLLKQPFYISLCFATIYACVLVPKITTVILILNTLGTYLTQLKVKRMYSR